MKSSTTQFRRCSPAFGKFMAALALGALLGGTSIALALGKDDGDRHDKGWHKGKQRSERNDNDRNERNEWNERNDYYYRERRDAYYYQPYYYSAPVYAPPPVYYPPQPSRGISLFFPLDLRR